MTEAAPAGGAPIGQLIALGLVYFGGTAAVVALVRAHRAGRTQVLERAGRGAGRFYGLPGWAALPVMIAVVGLLTAMWGGLGDIGYHINNGRDEGPLGNPGHWPLLLGIFTTLAAGIICLGMADQKDAGPSWVRIAPGWQVPLGGVLLTGCMAFGLATLGLDDVWHRIYGQDVTLWSPTHFVFLCGGILTVVGMLLLLKEGATARRQRDPEVEPGLLWVFWQRFQRIALLGGLLCGLELFLAEYDWGVPLYRQVWQPFLLVAFSALVFTTARAWVGPGSALGAWAFYAIIRLSGILVPMAGGAALSSMPLLIAAAISVELAALVAHPHRRTLAFGALAGLGCGTIGFAGEYAWSQLVMPLPWSGELWPEGPLTAAAGGVAAGVVGALFAAALRGQLPPPHVARTACVASFAALVALGISAADKHVPEARAHIALTDVKSPPNREALATIRLEPRDAADGANWLYLLAWQGGSGHNRVVDRLEKVGPGVYRSTRPIPLYGTWKVGLRMNRGRERGAVPMRLPVDRGLPNSEQVLPAAVTAEQLARAMRKSAGAALPAPASFTRPFGDDNLIVLRETKGDVPNWLWVVGLGLSALVWGLFVLSLTLGVARMSRGTARARAQLGAVLVMRPETTSPSRS